MSKVISLNQATANNKGLTKREHKRKYGSSTPGIQKGETCHASALDKAMLKYPRAHKVYPREYVAVCAQKDKYSNRKTESGQTL